MKTPEQIRYMIQYVERALQPGELEDSRGMLIMALEWALNEGISTSLGLWEWLEEFRRSHTCGKDTGFASRPCVLDVAHTGKCDWKSHVDN